MGFCIRTPARVRARFLNQQGWYAACMILVAVWQHLPTQLMMDTCEAPIFEHSAASTESLVVPYAEQQTGKHKPSRNLNYLLELVSHQQKHSTYLFVRAGKLPPYVTHARRFRSLLPLSLAARQGLGVTPLGVSAPALAAQINTDDTEEDQELQGAVDGGVPGVRHSLSPICEEDSSDESDSGWSSDCIARNQERTESSEGQGSTGDKEGRQLEDGGQPLQNSAADTRSQALPVEPGHNGNDSECDEDGCDGSR